jgi:sialate O-acetylesterase
MAMRLAAAATLLICTAGVALAEAPLMSGLFADHAVLQRDRPINVYGRAAAGDEVTVSLANASARA